MRDEWRRHLRACIRAKGRYFLNIYFIVIMDAECLLLTFSRVRFLTHSAKSLPLNLPKLVGLLSFIKTRKLHTRTLETFRRFFLAKILIYSQYLFKIFKKYDSGPVF